MRCWGKQRRMGVQSTGSGAIVERMIGAARLDIPTYEAIEHDESATPSAFVVVVLVAIASAIGGLDEGARGLIAGLLISIIGWVVFAAVAFFVGTKLIPAPTTQATIPQIMRTTGFAQAPGVFNVLGFIPVLGALIGIVVAIWVLITSIVGLRQALDMSTGRTIAVALISVIPYLVVVAIVGAIFNVGM